MKVEFINPFLSSLSDVLQQIVSLEVTTGKPELINSPTDSPGVTIIVGVTGDLKGQVFYNFSPQMALDFARAMMMGMEVDELDELAKSAISEMANITMGNIATKLSEAGFTVDLTPPSIVVGSEKITITSDVGRVLRIPMTTRAGDFDVLVGLKPK
jgi:chemotaxis protein CheX